MQKKIMVIGCGIYQQPIIRKAAEYGDVVLIAPAIDDTMRSIAYKCYLADVRDEERILEIAQYEQIDGVVTDQTDVAVRSVAYVAEKMGLPGIGYKTGLLFTDKGLMRRRLSELGLPVLPYAKVRTEEEALLFYRNMQSDVILKPVDNQGSRGVARVSNESELTLKFGEAKHSSKCGDVIIEKLATGREFVVEGLVDNYAYHTLICGDTDYFNIPDAYAAKTRIFPSTAPSELVRRVCERNKEIIEGFGLKQGITHSEFIMDGDEIYLIETAARGGGVFISSDLIFLGSGVHSEDFLIQMSLEGRADYNICTNLKTACGYMAFYLPDGLVERIDGIREVKALPYVSRHLLDTIHVGMPISNYNDKTSRFSIIVSGSNYEELLDRMDNIRKILNIQVRTSEGLRSPIWE